jgi:hypothetical protein
MESEMLPIDQVFRTVHVRHAAWWGEREVIDIRRADVD